MLKIFNTGCRSRARPLYSVYVTKHREILFPSGPRFGLTFMPKFDKEFRNLNIRYKLARYVRVPSKFKTFKVRCTQKFVTLYHKLSG